MAGPKYVTDFSFPSSFGFTGSASDRPTVPVRQHERQKPRFAEGGQIKKQPAPGGEPAPAPVDIGTPNPSKGKEGAPPKTPKKESLADIISGKSRREAEAELGLERGGKVHRAMGGPVKAAKGGKHFIQKAIQHPGALHRDLGIPQGQKIPAKKLEKAAQGSGKTAQRARFAETLKGFHKARGGAAYARGGLACAPGGEMKRVVKTALNQHIRAPKPRGHGVK